jgi:arylsulfatase A-like enzyme
MTSLALVVIVLLWLAEPASAAPAEAVAPGAVEHKPKATTTDVSDESEHAVTGLTEIVDERLFAAASNLLGSATARDTATPNFLILLTDDQGYGEMSFYGHPYLETPTMDRLARESMRFENFYVHPACAPTRAGLLTGRHYHRCGIWGVHQGRDYMALDETTFAEVLGGNGYATAMIGKWHNGKTGPYVPWERGFEDAWTKIGLYNHASAKFSDKGREVEQDGYARERITDWAIDYMESADEPFVLYVPFPTPHGPMGAPEEYIAKYQEKGLQGMVAEYYAMLDHLDVEMQRLVEFMDSSGLASNTVVLFFSDNGAGKMKGLTDEEYAIRNPKGLNHWKGSVWDGGVKSHLFVRWPGHIAPGENNALAQVTDLFPTLLDYADVPLPTDTLPIDGVSLRPVLDGETNALAERIVCDAAIVPTWATQADSFGPDSVRPPLKIEEQTMTARTRRHKLVHLGRRGKQPEIMLFDILGDRGETNNIAAQNPELVASLKHALYNWRREVQDDPKTFQRPLHFIGYPGDDPARFWFDAGVDWSPHLVNYVNCSGWRGPGDFVRWRTDVVSTGMYQAFVHGTISRPTGIELRIGEEVLTTTARGGGDIPLGSINVPQLGPQHMTFTVSDAAGTNTAVERLFFVILKGTE